MGVLYKGENLLECFYKTQSIEFGDSLRRFLVLGLISFALLIQPLTSAEQSSESAVYRITQNYKVTNQGTSNATDVTIIIYVLENWSEWASQEVLAENLPSGQVLDPEDNRFIRISIDSLGAGESRDIAITQTVRVSSIDLQFNLDTVGDSAPPEIGNTSHVDGLWESDTAEITNQAQELTDNQPNFYYKAKQIFEFVKRHVTYVQSPDVFGALQVYQSRTGDCADQSNLFIALCRAVDIPAKFVSCYAYQSEFEPNLGSMGHAFAIVYLPNVGWIPVDLTWNRPTGLFGELGSDHIISAISDGEDMFGWGGDLISPDVVRITYRGGSCVVELESSRITREVAVEPTIYAGSKIQNSTWRFSVDVSNVGTQSIDNVRVELQVDNIYFEVPPAEVLGAIGSGTHQMAYFDVHVKQSVENSPVTAVVTYDTSYGTFRAESQVSASATLPPPISELPIDLILILLACVVGAIAVVAVVLLRR